MMRKNTLSIFLVFIFFVSLTTIDSAEAKGHSPQDPIVKYINSTPEMPSIGLHMKNGTGSYSWDGALSCSWKNKDLGQQHKSFIFFEKTVGEEPWYIDFEDIIMGGDMKLSGYDANGTYQGSLYYKFLGQNPDKETIKDELGDLKYQIIAYRESLPKWHQFDANGYPTFGPPSGYGLMQLDPVPSYNELWDWKANVKEGKDHFDKDIAQSEGLPNYIKKYYNGKENVSELTDDQILRQAYYFYNAGRSYKWKSGNFRTYYIWDTKSDSWIVNSNAVHASMNYANESMRLYEDIPKGKKPPKW